LAQPISSCFAFRSKKRLPPCQLVPNPGSTAQGSNQADEFLAALAGLDPRKNFCSPMWKPMGEYNPSAATSWPILVIVAGKPRDIATLARQCPRVCLCATLLFGASICTTSMGLAAPIPRHHNSGRRLAGIYRQVADSGAGITSNPALTEPFESQPLAGGGRLRLPRWPTRERLGPVDISSRQLPKRASGLIHSIRGRSAPVP